MSTTGLDAATLARSLRRMAGDGSVEWVMEPIQSSVLRDIADMLDENKKLREQIERLQPKDCEGNALDIADTVSMLRSEYDGDHEWDDVVVELALTKWGGDRWIVRGSKGEAWACDCLKTGYDEDAYEGSDDAEPIANPSLIEVENDKLRQLVRGFLCEHADYIAEGNYCIGDLDLEHAIHHNQAYFRREAKKLGIEVQE